MRLTPEVLNYMESQGDTNLFFAATVLTLSIPRALHSQQRSGGGGNDVTPSAVRRNAVVACNLLAREAEAVLAVGTRSLYLLPTERIPIDDILEFVVHAHCTSTFPALEIRVGAVDGSSEVRFVALASEYMLRQAVAVLQTTCPFARLVFHSHAWVSKRRHGAGSHARDRAMSSAPLTPSGRAGGQRESDSANGNGHDSDLDEEDDFSLQERRANVLRVASDSAKDKLKAYRQRRGQLGQPSVAHVEGYGPGRYSEAAEALGTDLEKMLREVERMLTVAGPPEPVQPAAAGGGTAPRISKRAREPRDTEPG
jgi:hypothetical protein